MAPPNPTHSAPPLHDRGRGSSRLISGFVTLALGCVLWFGLDILSELFGRRAADVVSLTVFAAAGIGWLWRMAAGR